MVTVKIVAQMKSTTLVHHLHSKTVSSGSRIKRRLITPSSSPHSLSLPFNSFVVYLKASETSDILLPYCAVIIRISSSLTLALLSELHVADFTCAVQVVLQTLNNIQYFKSELKGFLSLHKLERAIIKIKAYLKFNQNKSLIKSLDRLLQPDFKKCLLSLEKTELPSMIEALCSSTCSSLRDVYKNLVHLNMRETLLSRYDDKEVIAHLDSLRIYCERRTRDYIDYLEVKTERNMTIEPFMEVSPNLLAFLYIDRVKNEVIYASSDDIGKLAFGRTSKTKDALNVLSDAVELAYTSLASGNLSSKWSIVQKQLHFNYFMWFEDMSGKHLVPEVKEFTLQSYPSIVGSNFINRNNQENLQASSGQYLLREEIDCLL
ncbi:hypothetical protein HDE_00847 [Halotydeus destructor]|nr:hypothetical protein HDE_00847 [Halotydeus destructor]